MAREKYNLIYELQKKNEELKGNKRLALVGQGDFPGGNNVMRSTMNIKHKVQHLAIDNPEFPMFFDGKENLIGEQSSNYFRADTDYKVVDIAKKYEELLKGKSYMALYFLYSEKEDKYIVLERKEVEDLTENFGFAYDNDFLDQCEVGETISKDTLVYASTSYDEDMNVGVGINGRILYGVDPAVQDDAIVVSESFAKRMVTNNVKSITIPINENTILLNLYGKDNNDYIGLPNIGDKIDNGILAATRTIKETRMFSDLRDSSLTHINAQTDQIFYADGEIIDINIYCNNSNIKVNKVNKQLVQYYNDSRWFYTKVYKICNKILKSGCKNIHKNINHWKRIAMNYLDTQAVWAYNDNVFSNMMVEILVRKKEQAIIGRKIVGRHGSICMFWPM